MAKTKISTKARNLTFGVMLIGTMISSLLQTALTTALPDIMKDFQVSATTGQWLTSGFSLAMGIMIPATAFLIKRLPTKILFIGSMTLFALGSLLSAIAPVFIVLLLGRIIQAMGTGILLSLTQVVILTIYPQSKQGAVMGIYGLAASAAPVIAPTLTGLLIDYMSWRIIFWVGLVIALIDIVLALVAVKNVLPNKKIAFDLPSFLLISVAFTGILIGFGNLGTTNFFSLEIGLPLLLAVIAGIGFVWRSGKVDQPLLDLTAFRNHNFRVAIITSILLYAVLIAASTLLPIYVQSVHHSSATISGLMMLPGSLLMTIMSPITGRLYDRFGIRPLALTGTILMFASSLFMTNLTNNSSIIVLTIAWAVRSCALACVMMPIVTWSVTTLKNDAIASASALLTTLRTIAGAVGAAISVAIMTYVSNLNHPSQKVLASAQGMNAAFIGLAVIMAIMIIIVFIGTKRAKTPAA
ncbi:MFS family major facilitator transporter, multidrug cation symporter [Agrilactobacillus composti DSM 18527 = JCM 14202]|uniref:MFS family major facilitator transporter, multidrug cation symporter n=2 Tax=Agrilactobacillus TaxID=2767875 RepID=A0A0R1XS51_9LACO|nr:MDR family MFS transporter [Agrilactobacillus composti]KRM30585.1 MFS family major facilitator transporter, multidrug cation symporter [Agrilactobacillus composti DSM 18527 = JCM 14202]